jgi:FkbM family methyltransferase
MSDYLTSSQKRLWVSEFEKTLKPRMVFGWNSWAESVCSNYDVSAIVDDTLERSPIPGIQLLRSEEIPSDAMTICTVVIGRPLTAMRRLEMVGADHIDYFALLNYSVKNLLPIGYWQGFENEFATHANTYAQMLSSFADSRSRTEFWKVVAFRLTYDLQIMSGFVDRQPEQYFETFLPMSGGETFVDVGAFDGFTTSEYIRRNPSFGVCHLFEPIPKNVTVLKEKFAGNQKVQIHNIVLGADHQEVQLCDAGSSSRMREGGEIIAEMRTLDSFVDIQPDIIKVDIEGAELEFLAGAKQKILRHRPSLVIAAYHQADHMRRIWEMISELEVDYRVYFRHYTEGFAESDLFFIPESKRS